MSTRVSKPKKIIEETANNVVKRKTVKEVAIELNETKKEIEELKKEIEELKLLNMEVEELETDYYLSKLKKSIKENNLSHFFVLIPPEGLETFSIIKKTLSELKTKFKNSPKKYKGYKLAEVTLMFNPAKNIKSDDWVFSIKIYIYVINNEGEIDTSIHDTWQFMLNYTENDINTHRFKMKNIENLITLVSDKKLVTISPNGIFYDEFLNRIEKLKKKYKKNIEEELEETPEEELEEKPEEESYLSKLKKSIEENNISDFYVLIPPEGLEKFNIIKTTLSELRTEFKNNPKKYKGYKLAGVALMFSPRKNIKPDDWVFCIRINIYLINNEGKIDTSIHDTWGFLLNYTENDINTHHFKMKDVEKLVTLVSEKKLLTGFFGIFYDEFLNRIKKLKKKHKKDTEEELEENPEEELEEKPEEESYLSKLKKSIEENNISDFYVLIPPEGLEKFNIIKTTLDELKTKFKNSPKKYKGYKLAEVTLIFSPGKNIKPDDWVFSIKIYIYVINNEGEINTSIHDTWSFLLNYTENDINTHHFKMQDVEKLVTLVSEKKLVTSPFGIFYDEFLNRIKKLKKKHKKNIEENNSESENEKSKIVSNLKGKGIHYEVIDYLRHF